MPKSKPRKPALMPAILGFKELFVPHQSRLDGNQDESELAGLPFGSTLLLSGPPGAGKTTFALSLVRSLMIDARNKGSQPDGLRSPIIYYISSEINLERLRGMFGQMGWFDQESAGGVRTQDAVFRTDDGGIPDSEHFYVVVPEPAVDRPVPTPEELVNDVFNRIAKSLSPSEAKIEECDVIVVVDSITALLKGCAENDERRHTHEILHRLRSMFGEGNLALTVLLAEQDHSDISLGRTSTVEDYLAEIVLRLYQQTIGLGRRLRKLEVVKSQGVNIIPGDHSWAIVTFATCGDLFRHDDYIAEAAGSALLTENFAEWTEQEEARRSGQPPVGRTPSSVRWGTVAIFPRPRLLHRPHEGGKESRKAMLRTGTQGLGEMLEFNPGFWLSPPGRPSGRNRQLGHLRQSSTTLLAGPVGSGKTTLCMQFLLQDAEEYFEGINDTSSSDCARTPEAKQGTSSKEGTNLFICLGPNARETVERAWQTMEKGLSSQEARDRFKKHSRCSDWVAVLDFTQSHFDFNQLMAHLSWALGFFKPLRIAFDGLAEWATMFERSDAAKMLEAISVVIHHHPAFEKADPLWRPRPTVFMTYEGLSGVEALRDESPNVAAENILMIKPINIQDEIRRIVYVLKSTHDRPDRNVRELSMHKARLQVRAGLDTFNGLLQGRTEPAEVLLQLFRENESQRDFNQWLVHRLSRLVNLRFKSLDFNRSEIGRTLEDTKSQTRFPPADLKIISLDQWWLGEKMSRGAGAVSSPVLDLSPIWSNNHDEAGQGDEYPSIAPSWQDFWSFELEKASPPSATGPREIYAVPGYVDFGMFCVNLKAIFDGTRAEGESNVSDKSGAGRAETPSTRAFRQLGRSLALEHVGDDDPNSTLERLGKAYYTRPGSHADAWAKRRSDAEAKSIIQDAWIRLSESIPRFWARPDKEGIWFERGPDDAKSRPTILGKFMQPDFGEAFGLKADFWLFSFDMATRENCACVFFEFAWAFGASEGFLTRGSNQADIQACETALRFLQLLVLEGLMPSRGTVNTTRRSLFSHHFYSTLQAVNDLERDDRRSATDSLLATTSELPRTKKGEVPAPPPPPPYLPPSLVALPLFPIGIRSEDAVGQLTKDAGERLKSLLEKFVSAGALSKDECLAQGKQIDDATSEARLPVCRTILNNLIAILRRPGGAGKSNMIGLLTPTDEDLLELTQWLALTVRLLSNTDEGQPIAELIRAGNSLRAFPVPPESNASEPALGAGKAKSESKDNPVLSGYSCAGSWMYGIEQGTRSPSLAGDLLQEVTSLEAAEERARRGAGIPTRREFFDLHGDDPVTGMEYLSWRELLRSCGARARQRENVIDAKNASVIHQSIQDELLKCLRFAELHVEDYQAALSASPDGIKPIVTAMNESAKSAVQKIRTSVASNRNP